MDWERQPTSISYTDAWRTDTTSSVSYYGAAPNADVEEQHSVSRDYNEMCLLLSAASPTYAQNIRQRCTTRWRPAALVIHRCR